MSGRSMDWAKVEAQHRMKQAAESMDALAASRRAQGYRVFASRKAQMCKGCGLTIAKGERMFIRQGRRHGYHMTCQPEPWNPVKIDEGARDRRVKAMLQRRAARTTPDPVKGGLAEDR